MYQRHHLLVTFVLKFISPQTTCCRCIIYSTKFCKVYF